MPPLRVAPYEHGQGVVPPPYFGTVAYTITPAVLGKHITVWETTVKLGRKVMKASGIEAKPKKGHPIYFVIKGQRFVYAVSIWANLVCVKLCRANDPLCKIASISFPRNETELVRILRDICQDYSLNLSARQQQRLHAPGSLLYETPAFP